MGCSPHLLLPFELEPTDNVRRMTAEPVAPAPDIKDWTWVIHERCPECGFDATAVERGDVPALTRRFASLIADALARSDAGERPQPTVWSPLEYACHVRDVCHLFAQRLDLMLAADDPQFANWDQNVTALDQRYWMQDPEAVATELRQAADMIAHAFAAVDGKQWDRPGRRSNGSMFTVDTFARYFLHDLAHHAWDITASRW
jgi:DinB superfamily